MRSIKQLTALFSELHASEGEVGIEAGLCTAFDGEVARDGNTKGENARIDRVAVGVQEIHRLMISRSTYLKQPRDFQSPTEGTVMGGGGGAMPSQ